jgi:6-phosphogluconolactonase
MKMKRMSARLVYAVAVLILAGCTGGGTTPSKFLFASNDGSNNVSAFTINASTGALTAVGTPVATGSSPELMAVTPNGKFLYVANVGGANVSAYSIDRTTGTLTAVPGSPFTTTGDDFPLGIAVDPSGKFVYTANISTISAFSINATSGALTDVPGTPFLPDPGTSATPNDLRVDPSGKFLYVSNSGPPVVSAFTINATSGALTAVAGSPFATTAPSLFGLAVDPTGKFVYVVDDTNNTILAFSINATSGALTAVAGSPFATGGTGCNFLTVERRGKFLYVSNVNSNDISGLAINATTGALTPIAGSPFSVGAVTNPVGIVTDASGKFGYAGLAGNNVDAVAAATINGSTGALTKITGSPFATGGMGAIGVAVASPK